MADLETRVDKLEGRMTSFEVTVEKLSQKVDDYIAESRAMQARHEADMREFREDMRNIREKQSSDVIEIHKSINDMGKHVRNMSVATILGIAAMVVAVLLK